MPNTKFEQLTDALFGDNSNVVCDGKGKNLF